MNHPHNECPMVGWHPSIGREMEASRILLSWLVNRGLCYLWQDLALTLSNFPIFLRHFANKVLISYMMVEMEGIIAWGRPAVIMWWSSALLTMLAGQLFSVTHFTIQVLHGTIREVQSLVISHETYWISGLLSERWETLTGCCPWQAKAVKIEPLWASASLTLIKVFTASLPKQWMAWWQRLAVEALSFESWKWWTPSRLVLQTLAAQGKKCHSQLL